MSKTLTILKRWGEVIVDKMVEKPTPPQNKRKPVKLVFKHPDDRLTSIQRMHEFRTAVAMIPKRTPDVAFAMDHSSPTDNGLIDKLQKENQDLKTENQRHKNHIKSLENYYKEEDEKRNKKRREIENKQKHELIDEIDNRREDVQIGGMIL